MNGFAAGVALGLAVGILLGLAAYLGYRRYVRAKRNHRTHKELEGNRVSTVAQVLHFAIQSAPDAVVILDRKRNVVLSNSRAHELGIVHEREITDDAWAIAKLVFEDKEPHELVITPPRRRGNRPVISVAGRVQLLTLDDDRYVVVYAEDDSEHRRMESARRDFVANVSHELKTPVGAISLLVETLMSVGDDPESVEYFGGKLMIEVHRMKQMINELISLSKLQGAESLPDPEVLQVDSIIADAMDRCRLAAEAADIQLVADEPSGLVVAGDRSMLITSLTNLITNAINYSPNSTPVSISRAVEKDAVVIRVTDRGIGIDPDDQQRVFERFFRVDKARSRNTGGTGLGLAIVKHVMNNHGGRVTLWSRPGTGSTFALELPVVDASQSEEAIVVPTQQELNRAAVRDRVEETERKEEQRP